MNGLRAARATSTSAVAAVAAWSSWSHMVHVALRYGERPEVAYALPVSVDGMLIVASAAMVEDKRADRKVRTSARLAFWVGVVASVAANIDAAKPHLGARIVAGWPALALLLVVEMLGRGGRRRPEAEVPAKPAVEAAAELKPKRSSTPATTSMRPRKAVAARTSGPRVRWAREELAAAARKLLAQEPELSRAEVAARLSVSDRRVRQVLAEGS